MRTTVTLDGDVLAAIQRLRRDRGLGMSQALNELARAGMIRRGERTPFRQRSEHVGLRVDVDDIADVLELLDEPRSR